MQWQANHHYDLAFNLLEVGDFHEAKNQAIISSKYFHELKSPDSLAIALDIGSLVDLNLHNFEIAINQAEESLKLRLEQKSPDLNISYNNLGEIYRIMGDSRKSIEYYEQAFKEAIKNNNIINEAIALNNLGIAYADIGNVEKSIEFFKRSQLKFAACNVFDIECSLDYANTLLKSDSPYEVLKILTTTQEHIRQNKSNRNLARFHLVAGKVHIQLRNLNLALSHLTNVNQIAEFNEFPLISIETKIKLIEVALLYASIDGKKTWLEKAQDWLKKAEILVIEIKKSQLLLEINFLKALLSKEEGEINNATKILNQIKKNDSINNYPEIKERTENLIQIISNSEVNNDKFNIFLYLDKISQLVETVR
ncbi:MAG: tetratricopeptide repeat protein [Candidatus Thorarchaeota archaeon]